jgi:hypothetical protein
MKLSRTMLRSMITKEMSRVNEGFVTQPGSVKDLYGPYSSWGRSSDWGFVEDASILMHFNQHKKAYGTTAEEYIAQVEKHGQHFQLDQVREALAGEMSGAGESMYQLVGPDGGAPLGKPLQTGDLMALIMADKDPSSSYKLSRERLSKLNMGNLTAEEKSIIGI